MAESRPRAPYASTGSITKVIEKHRQVGLQTMSLQRLEQIGVTESLAPRTLQALVFLGFYDENGNVTPEFDALRHAEAHEFKPRLAALLREAYAPVLEVLDPATATALDVENAFRGYLPTGQLSRIVQLFMGLMIYAGLMPEDRRRPPPSGGRPSGTGRIRSGASGKTKDVTADIIRGEPVRETPPETSPPAEDGHADGVAPERVKVTLGTAGTVSITVNVKWLELSDDQFTKLRTLIKDIAALGTSGDTPDKEDAEVRS